MTETNERIIHDQPKLSNRAVISVKPVTAILESITKTRIYTAAVYISNQCFRLIRLQFCLKVMNILRKNFTAAESSNYKTAGYSHEQIYTSVRTQILYMGPLYTRPMTRYTVNVHAAQINVNSK